MTAYTIRAFVAIVFRFAKPGFRSMFEKNKKEIPLCQ